MYTQEKEKSSYNNNKNSFNKKGMKYYHSDWPYTQPEIFNILNATSGIGHSLGFATLFITILPVYIGLDLKSIDAGLFLGLIISDAINSLVKRGIIRYTASTDDKNRVVLVHIYSVLMYSSVVRVLYLYLRYLLINNDSFKEKTIFFIRDLFSINPVIIIFAVLPIFLFLLPPQVNVLKNHYATMMIFSGNVPRVSDPIKDLKAVENVPQKTEPIIKPKEKDIPETTQPQEEEFRYDPNKYENEEIQDDLSIDDLMVHRAPRNSAKPK